jgi:hypothetical protein
MKGPERSQGLPKGAIIWLRMLKGEVPIPEPEPPYPNGLSDKEIDLWLENHPEKYEEWGRALEEWDSEIHRWFENHPEELLR